MRLLLLTLLLLPITLVADEVRVAVGMDRGTAIALVQTNGGTDIGPGLEMAGPKGEPIRGIYWEFRDYDAIITIAAARGKALGKVTAMTFWKKKDFAVSKMHRDQTEQKITALKLDTNTKEVTIEK